MVYDYVDFFKFFRQGIKMSLSLLLYIVDVISNMNCLLSLLFFIISGSLLVLLIAFVCSDDDDKEKLITILKYIYKKIWICISIVILIIILPSSKTMYLMLGSSYLQNSNIPLKVQQALELKLDDVISELRTKNVRNK